MSLVSSSYLFGILLPGLFIYATGGIQNPGCMIKLLTSFLLFPATIFEDHYSLFSCNKKTGMKKIYTVFLILFTIGFTAKSRWSSMKFMAAAAIAAQPTRTIY
jgi:hypothetical protein